MNNIGKDYMEESEKGLAERIARLQDEADMIAGDLPNIPDELKNRMQSLQDQISDLYAQISEEASYSLDAVEEAIVARPWTSALVAFGIGCIVGALMRPAQRRSYW
ncbi:MAG TPA: hypothetical protein VG867_10695 [Rhizomicrobium sp.]|nr:hypothetical protein [Rhizomicrobium sp.]